MRYTVVAVGKLKEHFWRDACAEYTKRLGAYGKVEIREVADIDPARVGGVEASRSREGEEILSVIPERSHVILLAIDGKQRSSDGVSPDVRSRADETFSFGPITLPHNLARVVLLEQIYRACKISRGEPYHK